MREYESTKALFAKVIQKKLNARVKRIQIAFGEICELDQDAIRKHWAELSMGTSLEQAELNFRLIIAEVQCMSCFKKYRPVNGVIHCINCGSYGAKILTGEEIHVEDIETEDE